MRVWHTLSSFFELVASPGFVQYLLCNIIAKLCPRILYMNNYICIIKPSACRHSELGMCLSVCLDLSVCLLYTMFSATMYRYNKSPKKQLGPYYSVHTYFLTTSFVAQIANEDRWVYFISILTV